MTPLTPASYNSLTGHFPHRPLGSTITAEPFQGIVEESDEGGADGGERDESAADGGRSITSVYEQEEIKEIQSEQEA